MSIPIKPQIKKLVIKKPNPKGVVKSIFKKYSSIILYFLAASLLFAGVIYLFGGDNYSVISFFWVQTILLVFGIGHLFISRIVFDWADSYENWRLIVFTVILSGFGVGFVLLSRILNEFPTLPLPYANGWILFIVPLVFAIAINYMRAVPQKIFQPWIYPYGKEIPIVEVINPIKVKFYVAKQRADDEYTEFALNVPQKYGLGDFMHYFIHRYNYDKNPDSPIYISPDNSDSQLYKWLFRRKPGSTMNSDVLDPSLSFIEQDINENDVVIVERYDYKDISEHKSDQTSGNEENLEILSTDTDLFADESNG